MQITAVIVTFNRLEKLRKALACYDRQTIPFRHVIVVDNHSEDGTAEFLKEWAAASSTFGRHVVSTEENLGGSGGFYRGQLKAMEFNPDWVFLADDDAYPDDDLVAQFQAFAAEHDVAVMSAVCGMVYHPSGAIECQHRSRYVIERHRLLRRISSEEADYQQPAFRIDFLSYVGVFLNGKALRQVGLVNPDYFIYFDDTEHSLRLAKYGPLWCVPAIRIAHDNQATRPQQPSPVLVSWDEYYFTRNEHVMLRRHFPLVALNRLRIALLHRLKGVDNAARNKLRWQAVKDAWRGRMGKHPLYRPGWQVMQSASQSQVKDR